MSRLHDERRGVLTGSSIGRSVHHTVPQSMEKEKLDNTSFPSHAFVNEANFRTIDLVKPIPGKPITGRSIAPASIGTSPHIQGMPSLLPNFAGSPYLMNHVPIHPNTIVGGGHASTHPIPPGIGAAAAAAAGMAPPRGGSPLSQRNSIPPLKPTNLPNQVQLPATPIPGRPTIVPPAASHRTGSPVVTTHLSSHNHPSDHRLETRTTILSEHHHTVRSNQLSAAISHPSGPATIQVIASGTAASPYIPAYLNKNMGMSSGPNLLKIGPAAVQQTNIGAFSAPSSQPAVPQAPAFKLGIGKGYPSGSSVIIPSTTLASGLSRPEHQQPDRAVSSFSRHSVPHSVNHSTAHLNLSAPATTTTVMQSHGQSSHGPSGSGTDSTNERNHPVSVPYPISTYLFHPEPVQVFPHSINMHQLPQNATFHPLIRPPPPASSVGSVPMFTLETSQRQTVGLPSLPVLSVATSKSHPQASEPQREIHRPEPLNLHGSTSFSLQNMYPNIQSSFSPVFSSSTTTLDSSIKPTILRKRPADSTSTTVFPVQPTEKELSSPLKIENFNSVSAASKASPPKLISHERSSSLDSPKPTNFSISSITGDMKKEMELNAAGGTYNSLISHDLLATTSAPIGPPLLTASLQSNQAEASPKKKPRKQHIITTEDRYSSSHPLPISYVPDADEEFLKSNETMKDLTPPKTSAPTVPSSSLLLSPLRLDLKSEAKEKDINGVNSAIDSRASEALKQLLLQKHPRYSIFGNYKVYSKAAHNHFYRYSDVRVKEEKKVSLQERCSSKTFMESSTGWRLHHLSSQLDDLVSMEEEVSSTLLDCQVSLPRPVKGSPHHHQNKSSEDNQLRILHDLIQGNIQRSRLSIEQLDEAKTSMLKILEHQPKAADILSKHKPKSRCKKKSAHS